MPHRSTVVIPPYAYGLPGVGFGGYAAGLLARRFDGGPVKVSFRRPLPLGTPVEVRAGEEGTYEIADGDGPFARAQAVAGVPLPPRVPAWEEARRAEKEHSPADTPYYTPDCYGCGMDREPGLGLRQNVSALPGHDMVATTWRPDPELSPGSAFLPAEHVWGALDCPAGWTCHLFSAAPRGTVTAYLAADVRRPVVPGEEYVSFAWKVSHAGRKYVAGSALATRDGELCAHAESLWLSPAPRAE
ncbi:PaaI family thioesterase [Streptomyces sp. NPDC088745]|uniref:PaaI family thioesterase n=1 Tax=Streptomyces sp. NPDC088745 TaxID=3365884 RepID=UPI0038114AE0